MLCLFKQRMYLHTCSSSWVLTTQWALFRWSATCSPPWPTGVLDRSCGCHLQHWTGPPRHSQTSSQHLWDSHPTLWCLRKRRSVKRRSASDMASGLTSDNYCCILNYSSTTAFSFPFIKQSPWTFINVWVNRAWQDACIPSGSDHSRSHIGPSCGTSCFLSMVRIWSSVWIEGDKPPCTQKIWRDRKTDRERCINQLMDYT